MPRRTLLAVLLALAAPASAVAQNPTPPKASTAAASDVAANGATAHGHVDPVGTATTYHVEYGTSTAYGLTTPDRALAEGAAAVDVTEPLSGLTSATTYHVRVVATNAAGTARGRDVSFRTLSAPATPTVSTPTVSGVSASGATLAARVNPQALDTNYTFDYGTTTRYGTSTPVVLLPASRTTAAVSAPLAGLASNTLYHVRIRATNRSGTRLSGDRTFRTAKLPVDLDLATPPSAITYGKTLTLAGTAGGSDRAGLTVLLERRTFPFTADFATLATGRTDAAGNVSFSVAPFTLGTEFRLSAAGAVSATVRVGVKAKVSLHLTRLRGRRLAFSGTVAPGSAAGTVSLERRTATGHWAFLKRTSIRAGRYALTVHGRSRTTTYRVATRVSASTGLTDGRSGRLRVRPVR